MKTENTSYSPEKALVDLTEKKTTSYVSDQVTNYTLEQPPGRPNLLECFFFFLIK